MLQDDQTKREEIFLHGRPRMMTLDVCSSKSFFVTTSNQEMDQAYSLMSENDMGPSGAQSH